MCLLTYRSCLKRESGDHIISCWTRHFNPYQLESHRSKSHQLKVKVNFKTLIADFEQESDNSKTCQEELSWVRITERKHLEETVWWWSLKERLYSDIIKQS